MTARTPSKTTSHPPNEIGKLSLIRSSASQQDAAQYYAREDGDPLSQAFERKTAVHAGMSGNALSSEDIDATFQRLLDAKRTGKSAVYVHIPFCETHCLYCGFYSTPYKKERSAAYVDTVLAEIQAEKERTAVKSAPIHAVYLGGGTPTSLEADDLRRLLLGIREHLPLANDCEITVEGRVFRFGPEKMQACIDGGANRFSLGVQTFDTRIRKSMGRICERSEVINALEHLMRLDNAAVVIDLIYGLPGQTAEEWEHDLKMFDSLGLDGCDLYQLNIFPGGKLDAALKAGEVAPAADIAGQSKLFRQGVEFMNSRRMRRLSISHWGRSTRERNIYNPLMKSRANCLAYGAGAGGSLQGHFYFVQSNFEEYMTQRSKGRKPVVMLMEPPANAALIRSLTGQLESGVLDLNRTSHETGMAVDTLYSPPPEPMDARRVAPSRRRLGRADPGGSVLAGEHNPGSY